MRDIIPSTLSQRIHHLHWQLPLLAFLLVLADQLIEHTWLVNLPIWAHFASQLLFYGFGVAALAWWALTLLRRRIDELEAAQQALRQAHAALTEANQRLEFLVQVNRRLTGAEDEEALIEAILALPVEVVPAAGCSLIRFDERGQPLPAVHRGSLAPAAFDAWAAHISASDSGAMCESCRASRVTQLVPCPLAATVSGDTAVNHIHCLPLSRRDREYGLLSIYVQDAEHPDAREQALLAAMASEISLALESHHLRGRELSMLYHLQQARQVSNLRDTLIEVLARTIDALEIDGAALFLVNPETAQLDLWAEAGGPLGAALGLAQGLAGGVQQARAKLIISDLEQGEAVGGGLRSLLVTPLFSEDRSMGSLVLWAAQPAAFTRRHVRLTSMLAGQIALLVENHRLYLQAEYQAALSERARLAREIHDGLAQTLGYLKLRAAQVSEWLDGMDMRQAGDGLREIRDLLGEAYVDAREAIDGLRLKPGDGQLGEWWEQVLLDFESLSGIPVEAMPPPELSLPPEVQAQLLRIVQEALSNIRKHSQATRVRLEWQANADWLTLRVADNGRGFEAADVPLIAQHGLRMMRERAELLDADFQLISRSDAGTQVIVRLPVKGSQWEECDA